MKTKSIKVIALLLSGTMLFSSCATLFTSTQTIRFQSDKDGKVYQNLSQIGNTNSDIQIKRRDIVKLYTIKTTGCPDVQMELPLKINPVYFVDVAFILLGAGLLGTVIDLAFGTQNATDRTFQVNTNKCIDK